jgi:hypothetical protein
MIEANTLGGNRLPDIGSDFVYRHTEQNFLAGLKKRMGAITGIIIFIYPDNWPILLGAGEIGSKEP